MATSRFSSDECVRARNESDQLERAMRAILKMFADGSLVYRERNTTVPDKISSRSDRIRRLRAQATTSPCAAPAT